MISLVNIHNFVFTDATFTIDQILEMTKEVVDWKTLTVMVGTHDPRNKIEKVLQHHKNCESQRAAVLKGWYETHPFASWSLLHQALVMMGETETAQAIQEKFLQGTYECIIHVFSTLICYMVK